MVVNWVERITACVNPDDILADLLCEGDSCTPSVTEGDPPPESNVVAEVQEGKYFVLGSLQVTCLRNVKK